MSKSPTAEHLPMLPEDSAAVEAFDRMLRQSASEIVDYSQSVHERYAARQVTTLKGTGWPLRPLFLNRATTDFIGTALHQAFEALTQDILEHAGDLDFLQEKIALPRELFENLDFAASLQSSNFLSLIRPDGFLYPDRFVLTEINFGNGTIVSNAYSEVLFDAFQNSPVFQKLGWDVARHLPRSFMSYIDLIKQNLPPGKAHTRIALLAHHWEHQVILSWEERVIQALYFAQDLLREAGIDSVLVHEDELFVDEQGQAILVQDGLPVDAVVQVTIGTSFMDEPERLAGDLSFLRGPLVGNVPLIKPIASLCMDKGTMPYFSSLPIWPLQSGFDFSLQIVPTWYPQAEDATRYRLNKDAFVLKRAFDGKDTYIGVSTPGRAWNRALEDAFKTQSSIMQDYLSLPKTVMPVLLEGLHLEWIPVRVELSPFVINGRFAGAIARYAPDAEGLILSPPPEGMGITTVWCVD